MEREDSLPHLQMPATCTFREPARSSPWPPHPTFWSSILILFSHLLLGLPNGLFPLEFPTKTLYTSLISPIHATCPIHLIILYLITRTIMGEYRSLSTAVCSFSSLPCYLFPLTPKYSPQHCILKHLLPQCDRPSFTPIQNNRQNYSSICLNIYIFGATWKKKSISNVQTCMSSKYLSYMHIYTYIKLKHNISIQFNTIMLLCVLCVSFTKSVKKRTLTLILLMWRIGWAPNSIPIYSYIKQDATLHSLLISGNCSTCFGWYFHPSSGTHTTVSTASGNCHTLTAICRYRGRVGNGLSVLWVA